MTSQSSKNDPSMAAGYVPPLSVMVISELLHPLGNTSEETHKTVLLGHELHYFQIQLFIYVSYQLLRCLVLYSPLYLQR